MATLRSALNVGAIGLLRTDEAIKWRLFAAAR
jgi:hypothetical protein